MQSYKNNSNSVLDNKNGSNPMKRSFNNNPMTLSVDFNNGAMGLGGNSGSGKAFNFKLPAMNNMGVAGNDSLKMTRNSSCFIPK